MAWVSEEQGFFQERRSNSLEVVGTRIPTLPPGLDNLRLKKKKAKLYSRGSNVLSDVQVQLRPKDGGSAF